MADTYQSPAQPTSGTGAAQDPTNTPGQYPSSLFGVDLPQGTGAAGTEGATDGNRVTDPTGQPGQYPATEPISGVSLGGTGAPGSEGAMDGPEDAGDVSVTYSLPGFYKGEGVDLVTSTQADISGPDDWTAPVGNYPPQHPLAGTPTPTSTGAGQGRVMRGGRAVR
jgi:hypothetical protein